MPFDAEQVPTRKELLLDLAAFGGTVVVAVLQDWRASDLVWASWIASLIMGLLFFLVLSSRMLWDYAVTVPGGEGGSGGVRRGRPAGVEDGRGEVDGVEQGDGPRPMDARPGCLGLAVGGLMGFLAWIVGPGPTRMVLLALVGLDVAAMVVSILASQGWFGLTLRRPCARALFYLPTSLYLFFFFLVHFGGFHLGHAFVLGFFVPPEVEFNAAAEAVDGIRGALVGIREGLAAFLFGLALAYWPYLASVALKSFGTFRAAFLGERKPKDLMRLPYRNVVRVHLLIFALIPLAAFDSGLVMTIGVLVFFFFPVELVVARQRNR